MSNENSKSIIPLRHPVPSSVQGPKQIPAALSAGGFSGASKRDVNPAPRFITSQTVLELFRRKTAYDVTLEPLSVTSPDKNRITGEKGSSSDEMSFLNGGKGGDTCYDGNVDNGPKQHGRQPQRTIVSGMCLIQQKFLPPQPPEFQAAFR
ncbi:MAG: hypothetical protein J5737_04290 [Bacteroidales bacterium]|nr:hypothetical protein [Bacteroidales bacterium]